MAAHDNLNPMQFRAHMSDQHPYGSEEVLALSDSDVSKLHDIEHLGAGPDDGHAHVRGT